MSPVAPRRRALKAGGLLTGVSTWPGRGAPLVALHGFTGDGADFGPLAARLGRPVVALDLLGHGLSSAPARAAPYALDAQVGRLVGALDRLDLRGPLTLLGYSLGARVALHLVRRHPGRVRALVLLGGTAGLEDRAERAARRDEDAARAAALERDGVAAFLAAWRAQPLIATQARAAPEVRASMRRRRARLTPQGLAHTLRALSPGALPPLWDALPSLAQPALLVTGGEDARYDALAARLAARLPRASRAVIAGAGHAPHLERPAACARALRAFLGHGARQERPVRDEDDRPGGDPQGARPGP